MFSSRKYCACTRLPMSRPCMSVNATTTVSIDPLSTSRFSSSSVSIGEKRREPDNSGPLPLRSILRRWCGHRRTGPFAEPLLDPRQLVCRTLRYRTLEPLPRREDPPAADEQQRADDRDRRVVEAQPREPVLERDPGRADGQEEQLRDDRHPDNGDRPDRLVPAAEVPFARLPRVAQAQPEVDRD